MTATVRRDWVEALWGRPYWTEPAPADYRLARPLLGSVAGLSAPDSTRSRGVTTTYLPTTSRPITYWLDAIRRPRPNPWKGQADWTSTPLGFTVGGFRDGRKYLATFDGAGVFGSPRFRGDPTRRKSSGLPTWTPWPEFTTTHNRIAPRALSLQDAPKLETDSPDPRSVPADVFWCIAPVSVFDTELIGSRQAVSMWGTAIRKDVLGRYRVFIDLKRPKATGYLGKVTPPYNARYEADPIVSEGRQRGDWYVSKNDTMMRGSKHKLASGDSVHLDALPPKLSTEESSDLSLQYRTASDLRDRAEEILYRSFDPYMHRVAPGPPLFEDRRERRAHDRRAHPRHARQQRRRSGRVV